MGVFSDYTGPQEFRDAEAAWVYAWDWTVRVASEKDWPKEWTEYGTDLLNAIYGAEPDDALEFWLWLVDYWQPEPNGAPDGWLDLYNMWALAGQMAADAEGWDAEGNFATVVGGTVLETIEDTEHLTIEISKAVSDWRTPLMVLAAAYIVSKVVE